MPLILSVLQVSRDKTTHTQSLLEVARATAQDSYQITSKSSRNGLMVSIRPCSAWQDKAVSNTCEMMNKGFGPACPAPIW